MRYNFNLVIGDYFGEGHGKTQSFHAGADKPMEDVLKAQTQIIAKTGIDLHSFANKFEDNLIPADVVQQLKDLSYPFNTELYEDEMGLHFQTADTQADCPEEMAAIWLFLLNCVDPDLNCSLEPIPELFGEYGAGSIGYGLFPGMS